MTLNDQIYVASLSKALDKGKLTGQLNSKLLVLFELLSYYDTWTRHKSIYQDVNKFIKDQITTLKFKYPAVFCDYNAVLPSGSYFTDGTVSAPTSTSPTFNSFTVDAGYYKIYPNSDTLYYGYKLNKSDILDYYSDNEDDEFYQIKIDQSDLDLGKLKISTGSGVNDYVIFEQAAGYVTILADELSDVIYFTDDTTQDSNQLTLQIVDKDSNNNFWLTSAGTITMDKTFIQTGVFNEPPTVGDSAIDVGNRVTTVITTTMLTVGLTPPYNDPEGDALDAVRIDEVSTANTGVFYLDGVAISDGQIITKAQLDAGLFTHVGPDSNAIETDAFSFSVRDAKSLIWVN